MKVSNDCITLIKQFEGCRLTAYKCPAGVWTIGYGHTAGVKEGMKISQAQAELFLLDDLQKYEKRVNKYDSKYNWKQNEFDALVSFCYNVGSIDQLTDNGTRSRQVIAEKMLLYNKGGGKVLPGLVRRRKAECDLFTPNGKDENKVLNMEVPLAPSEGIYYPKYNGTTKSIVEALKSLGIDSSYKYREKIALANGIVCYIGAADQNTLMLKKLKDGVLKRP